MARQALDIGTADNVGGETIRSGGAKINDMTAELYTYRPFNVMDYGAKGDSNYNTASGTDDAAAFQAALNAASAAGGPAVIHVPGGRTYRIGTTLAMPIGVHVVGTGGKEGAGTASPPILVWSGVAGGTMLDWAHPLQNIPQAVVEGIAFMGRLDKVNLPAIFLRFRGTSGWLGSLDTGSMVRRCGFHVCSGNAISCEGGATNFLVDACRWDQCAGYGIYADINNASGVLFSCTITGNSTWTTDGSVNGFIYVNGETGTEGLSSLKLIGVNLEVGHNLNQTYAGGANPVDRQGLIRLGVNAAKPALQHTVSAMGIEVNPASNVSSFSLFQITAAAGVDLDNARMVNLMVMGLRGTKGTTETGATNEVRAIGGRVPAVERPPFTGSVQQADWRFGIGKNFTGDHVTSWINSRNYILRTPILQPLTVAQLPTDWPKDGMLAYVTDATATTRLATVAGGGTNRVMVQYRNNAWLIV